MTIADRRHLRRRGRARQRWVHRHRDDRRGRDAIVSALWDQAHHYGYGGRL